MPERIAQLKAQIHGLSAKDKSDGDIQGVDQASAAIMMLARDIDHPIPHNALRNTLSSMETARVRNLTLSPAR